LGVLLASGGSARGENAVALYDKAMAKFEAGKYRQALETIDSLTAAPCNGPERAEALNLRGVILIRQRNYAAAELSLRQAIESEPELWNALFNFAQIPFLKKNWPEARRRFQKMLSSENGQLDSQTRQLIQYKILLTQVLEGNASELKETELEVEELGDDDPAAYYLRAALARQREQSAEAAQWMAKAKARFPGRLNRLYTESLCEIGWETKQPEESPERFEIDPARGRNERLQAEAKANLARAEAAFLAHDDAAALRWLDAVDLRLPHQAASHNLRAEILMAENALSEAEVELWRALAANPNLREAAYNLAEIAFRQRRYHEARDLFEQLFAGTPEGDSQPAQLIEFKVFLTFLLQGEEESAKPMMARFQFTGVTPALYYAKAAWAFRHGEPAEAAGWIDSAQRIYSPALNLIFADSFYQLGWLQGKSVERGLVFTPAPAEDICPLLVSGSPERYRPALLSLNGARENENAVFDAPLSDNAAPPVLAAGPSLPLPLPK
jgi:tetratricopeptide (TPR) repeat protein